MLVEKRDFVELFPKLKLIFDRKLLFDFLMVFWVCLRFCSRFKRQIKILPKKSRNLGGKSAPHKPTHSRFRMPVEDFQINFAFFGLRSVCGSVYDEAIHPMLGLQYLPLHSNID